MTEDPPVDGEYVSVRIGLSDVGKIKRKQLSTAWSHDSSVESPRRIEISTFHSENSSELSVISQSNANLSDGEIRDALVISLPKKSSEDDERKPLLHNISLFETGGQINDSLRFKMDVTSRPDELKVSSDAYVAVPVEKFGEAMLRGMGWIAPTTQQNDTTKDMPLVAREPRLGLGAIAKPPSDKSKKQTEKQAWNEKAELLASSASEKLVVGDLVWLRDISYAGRRACVTNTSSVAGLDRIEVCLESNGDLVKVKKSAAILLTANELAEKPYVGFTAEKKIEESLYRPVSSGKRKPDEGQNEMTAQIPPKKIRVDMKQVDDRNADQLRWLRQGIRVRIISKTIGGENAYLQKGDVLDIYGSNLASIRLLASGAIIEGVQQQHLETVLPSVGMMCLVLTGTYKGLTARLLEKRKDEQKVVLEMQEDLSVVVVGMEEVAALS